MAKGFKHGAGGAGLNFKVICNPQPSTAKENTIWVDTDRINNYYFSATQPENMVEYDVWFPTGTYSTVAFSATKKNPIMVYPISAKQYISGAWIDKTAKSYQGGEWVDWWDGQLYDAGNEYIQHTGGIASWAAVSSVSTKGSITKNDTNIVLSATSGCSIAAGPSNRIDLSKFSKFCINVTSACSATRASIRIFSDKSAGSYSATFDIPANATGIFTLDISSVNGELYPAAMVYSQSGTMTMGFDKLWLE